MAGARRGRPPKSRDVVGGLLGLVPKEIAMSVAPPLPPAIAAPGVAGVGGMKDDAIKEDAAPPPPALAHVPPPPSPTPIDTVAASGGGEGCIAAAAALAVAPAPPFAPPKEATAAAGAAGGFKVGYSKDKVFHHIQFMTLFLAMFVFWICIFFSMLHPTPVPCLRCTMPSMRLF